MERISAIFLIPLFATLMIATSGSAAANGTGATLSWSAPTVNADGSKISDLIGFNVYHGTSPTSMLLAASVAAGTTHFADPNLTPSLWYWYITAVNSQGIESEPSIIVTKLIVADGTLNGANPVDPSNGGNLPVATTGGGTDPGNAPSGSGSTHGTHQRSPYVSNAAKSQLGSTHCGPFGHVWCSR